MSPSQVLERSYDAIKRQLIEGAFRAGQRLEAALLAEQLHASITPVRDVLNRLTGERLVQASAGNGFHVPIPDESGLRDLLDWNAHLIIQAARSDRRPEAAVRFDPAPDAAARTAAIFLHIARGPGNAEYVHAVASANDRLHAMRILDDRVIGPVDQELGTFEAAVTSGQSAVIVRQVRHYHRRRKNRLSTYARLLRAQSPFENG